MIEELTLNPFFAPKNVKQEPECDLWVEFVLRNGSSAPKRIDQLPVVELQLRDLRSASVPPRGDFTESDSLPSMDINKLCYAEIWASFIPAADGRGDFMKVGYRKPMRRIGPDVDFKELANHFDGAALPQPHSFFRQAADDLRNRLVLFEEVFAGTAKAGRGQMPVPRGLGYRESEVDVDDDIPPGALAFSREPWGAEPALTSPETVFACETVISRSGLRWTVTPRPIVARSAAHSFNLAPGQRLAFWLLIRDAHCTRADTLRTAFTFQLDVISSDEIEHFNSFFRIAPAFQFREGALTELRRYAAPPRLFAVWDSYEGSECYAHHSMGVAAENPHKINADFLFAKLDIKKLSALFLLGLLINSLISLAINMFTALAIGQDNDLPGTIRITELSIKWPLRLVLIQALCATALVCGVILLMYQNKLRNWLIPSILASGLGIAVGYVLYYFL